MLKFAKKPFAVLLALTLCLSFAACGNSDELIEYKAQTADFTLMLPEGFTEKSDNENVTCYFEGENELVTCLREPREDIISVAGKEELTLDEYAQLVIDVNGLSSQIGKDDKENTFFTRDRKASRL